MDQGITVAELVAVLRRRLALLVLIAAIGSAAMWLWSNAIKPAFNSIWGIAKSVFGWIANTGWLLLRTAFNAIGSVVSWLWNNIYQPYFTKIWGIAKTVFGWIKNTGWPWVRSALSAIGSAAARRPSMVRALIDAPW